MAKRRRKRKAADRDFPTEEIVLALTPAIKARLKRKGLFSNKRVVRFLRVVYQNGKVAITDHAKGAKSVAGGKFVPSNSCFA